MELRIALFLSLSTILGAQTLTPDSVKFVELDTQNVQATLKQIHTQQISTQSIKREELKFVPGSMADPIRALYALPGVESANDISLLPFVRGGDWDETKVYWNSVPLLSPFHSLSMFSVFNMESIDKIELYKGFLPASGDGALSGAIYVSPRKTEDSLRAVLNVNSMRAGAWMQIPIQKSWYLDFSGQTFYMDQVKNFLLEDVISSSDPNSQKKMKQYTEYLQFPSFTDVQGSLRHQSKWGDFEYATLYSNDRFRAIDPREDYKTKKISLDTMALVERNSWIQKADYTSNLNANWKQNTWLSYQTNTYDIIFFSKDYTLDDSASHFMAHTEWQWNKDLFHWTHGLQFSKKDQLFRSKLNRFVYKIIMEANPDPADALGQVHPDGISFNSKDQIYNSKDFLETVQMNISGRSSSEQMSYFTDGDYALNLRSKIQSGLRVEWDWASQSLQMSPRLAYSYLIDDKSKFSTSTGIYTQKDFANYYLILNPKLRSEKNWQTDMEYFWAPLPKLNLTSSLWYKKYWDLVSQKVRRDTNIVGSNRDVWTGSKMENKLIYDTTILSQLALDNEGVGQAYGLELSTEYRPWKTYLGRLSWEWGNSERGDDLSSREYPFAKFRDWKIKWFHHFEFGQKHAFDVRLYVSKGLPYTGFSYKNGFVVEPRLNKNYQNYRRIDMRFSKKDKFFGFETLSYFEIWNAWYTPNLFQRDSESGEIKFLDFNLPVPMIFGGWEIYF